MFIIAKCFRSERTYLKIRWSHALKDVSLSIKKGEIPLSHRKKTVLVRPRWSKSSRKSSIQRRNRNLFWASETNKNGLSPRPYWICYRDPRLMPTCRPMKIYAHWMTGHSKCWQSHQRNPAICRPDRYWKKKISQFLSRDETVIAIWGVLTCSFWRAYQWFRPCWL